MIQRRPTKRRVSTCAYDPPVRFDAVSKVETLPRSPVTAQEPGQPAQARRDREMRKTQWHTSHSHEDARGSPSVARTATPPRSTPAACTQRPCIAWRRWSFLPITCLHASVPTCAEALARHENSVPWPSPLKPPGCRRSPGVRGDDEHATSSSPDRKSVV